MAKFDIKSKLPYPFLSLMLLLLFCSLRKYNKNEHGNNVTKKKTKIQIKYIKDVVNNFCYVVLLYVKAYQNMEVV